MFSEVDDSAFSVDALRTKSFGEESSMGSPLDAPLDVPLKGPLDVPLATPLRLCESGAWRIT